MRALLVALVVASSAAASAPAAVVGELRVLAIRATWGPTVGSDEQARAALDEVEALYTRSSFGKLRVRVDVTPWLRAYPGTAICPTTEDEEDERRSALGPISGLGRAAAAAAGFDIAEYHRVAFLLPERVCGLPGLGVRGEVLLAIEGGIGAPSFVHELGHTLGLPHATGAACLRCRVFEYGDRLSPMGGGFVDFGAWEKSRLGWLTAARVARTGTYRVAAADRPATQAQALVVPTREGDIWIEHRTQPRVALVVRVVRTRSPVRHYLQATLLARTPRAYTIAGVVAVRRVRLDGDSAVLRVTLSRSR